MKRWQYSLIFLVSRPNQFTVFAISCTYSATSSVNWSTFWEVRWWCITVVYFNNWPFQMQINQRGYTFFIRDKVHWGYSYFLFFIFPAQIEMRRNVFYLLIRHTIDLRLERLLKTYALPSTLPCHLYSLFGPPDLLGRASVCFGTCHWGALKLHKSHMLSKLCTYFKDYSTVR